MSWRYDYEALLRLAIFLIDGSLVTRKKCKEACRSRSACTAVNYRRNVGYCVLLGGNITNSAMVLDPRLLYSVKTTWSQVTTSSSCNTQCSDTEVCRVDSGQVNCDIEECGNQNVTQFETSQIYGNLRQVGSKVLYSMACTDALTANPVYTNISGLCETDGNWTIQNTSCSEDISSYVNHVGCYKDQHPNRVLPDDRLNNDNMTITMCAQYCYVNRHIYFGVQFGAECFCGFTFNNISTSNECTKPCGGNPSEICGGGLALNLYTYQ